MKTVAQLSAEALLMLKAYQMWWGPEVCIVVAYDSKRFANATAVVPKLAGADDIQMRTIVERLIRLDYDDVVEAGIVARSFRSGEQRPNKADRAFEKRLREGFDILGYKLYAYLLVAEDTQGESE